MKYLYTLTSTPQDYYYEQFLLSLTSLKLKNPDAKVTLLCDSKTKSALAGKRSEYEKLVSDVIIAQAPVHMTQMEISRWVKTSMRRLVQGDFLFIDCDTIITDDLSFIAELGIKFGACLDKHSPISTHSKKDKIIEREKKMGFTSYLSNKHINSGVIYCLDCPENMKLFDRWHELWLLTNNEKIRIDQTAFNMAIYENQSLFTELDGIWNCQIDFNGLPYLADSRIIHYYASYMYLYDTPYILGSHKILETIKETGTISAEIKTLLENPKAAFSGSARIINEQLSLDIVNSHVFEILLWLRKHKPSVFKLINSLCSLSKKFTKSILSDKTKGL